MSDVSLRLQALSLEQRELLRAKLRERGPEGAERAAAPPVGARASSPTSRSQGQCPPARPAARQAQFSLFFFSDEGESCGDDKYALLIDCARWADEHGFLAIWTPERHFHPFGGLYPNPAVLSAALAMVTQRLQLRAGSVVLPLHHSVRVAEEWSLVDNLSHGRAGVAFASGWPLDDFVLAPDAYEERKDLTFREILTVQRLWAGEAVRLRGPQGGEVETRAFPLPLQARLPVWVTSAGQRETFVRAGALGLNLLTGLTGQSVDELGEKIGAYRRAREDHGHDPAGGCVTAMLHSFLGSDEQAALLAVRGPMQRYLGTNLGLHSNLARSRNAQLDLERFTEDDRDAVLEFAFQRYANGSALFGTPESCLGTVERLVAAGVGEIACLLDFGLDARSILGGLEHLDRLRRLCSLPHDAGERASQPGDLVHAGALAP